jgi:dihydroorotate dehydrogenase
MYPFARKLLFALNPELSHELSIDLIGAAERMQIFKLFKRAQVQDPRRVMGLDFPNAVGLAAGLDKNADCYNGLGALGFGFLELGTVTPLPQPGNDKPRLFRLKQDQAIINRMGFNNKGVDHLVEQMKNRRFMGPVGINIGKNKVTPEENALDDYVRCMEKVYVCADYITVNISSPNTPGLRNLQHGESLKNLLSGIKQTQQKLSDTHGQYTPIAVKVAPDNSSDEEKAMAEALLACEMDAVIISNTTLDREGLQDQAQAEETGGLSGKPVFEKSTACIERMRKFLGSDMPIIGVGGIFSAEDALAKVDAGANLVQLYTGFIYRGPELIEEVAQALKNA